MQCSPGSPGGSALATRGAWARLQARRRRVLRPRQRHRRRRSRQLIERSAAALTEEGEGFSVSCSFGAVLMPVRGGELTEALRIADDRMYLHKQRNRPGADRQSIDVLISVLEERDSQLAHHLADVADLAEAVGRRLQVPEPQLADDQAGGRAARRRQARDPGGDPGQARPAGRGRVGVRPAPHGDRRANPRLGARARSGREDRALDPRALGRDRLSRPARRHRRSRSARGSSAVCDAFDAMTSHRPYAAALTREDALRELFRCAGTQFDSAVRGSVRSGAVGPDRDRRLKPGASVSRSASVPTDVRDTFASSGHRPGQLLLSDRAGRRTEARPRVAVPMRGEQCWIARAARRGAERRDGAEPALPGGRNAGQGTWAVKDSNLRPWD